MLKYSKFSEKEAKEELADFKKKIKNDQNVIAAYLFGSYLTGNTKEESDVDICIIPKDQKYDVCKYTDNLLQISNFWKLPPNMQYHILHSSKEIYVQNVQRYNLEKLKFKAIGEYDFYKRNILKKREELMFSG